MADNDTPWAPLVDVSDLSVREVFESDDTALAACVRRLIANLDNGESVLSAFQSFTS